MNSFCYLQVEGSRAASWGMRKINLYLLSWPEWEATWRSVHIFGTRFSPACMNVCMCAHVSVFFSFHLSRMWHNQSHLKCEEGFHTPDVPKPVSHPDNSRRDYDVLLRTRTKSQTLFLLFISWIIKVTKTCKYKEHMNIKQGHIQINRVPDIFLGLKKSV